MELIKDGRRWPTVNATFLVRDRFRLTKQTLLSYCRNTCVPGPLSGNTTILDDRSNSQTSIFLYAWKQEMHCLLLRNDEPIGTGQARNRVIAACREHWTGYQRGDYLYLSDNDVFFCPSWLESLIHCYEVAWEHGFRVIGGYNHPYHLPVSSIEVGLSTVNEVLSLATQSMLMRWEVWDEFGPFNETPVDKVCQSEDVDFGNKIRAAGYKLGVVDPPLIVSTGITNTFGEKIPGYELVKAQCPEGVICL